MIMPWASKVMILPEASILCLGKIVTQTSVYFVTLQIIH